MSPLLLAGALAYVGAEDRPRAEKPAQLMTIAWAAVEASHGRPTLLAMLLAVGFLETGYSLRVHEGYCHATECDKGRARGPWQTWRNGMSEESWARMTGLINTLEQAKVAASRLAWGMHKCGTVRGALAVYMGLGCFARSPHLDLRYGEYTRALRAVLGGKNHE